LNEERLACLAHLQKQIGVIQPRVVIALGASIAAVLLNQSGNGILSGEFNQSLTYEGMPLIVTAHPRQILAQPIIKRQVWRDLCLALKLFCGADAVVQAAQPMRPDSTHVE
jgi:DNA polymerase